ERRRARIYSLTSGIPTILWYTVAVGALINMILLWLFDLRPHAHWILGGLISFYLGTVISVTALMDHPYRGELRLITRGFRIDLSPGDRSIGRWGSRQFVVSGRVKKSAQG